jgi:hypothetical protein
MSVLDDLLLNGDCPGELGGNLVIFCADHTCACGRGAVGTDEVWGGAFRLDDLVEAVAKHRARFPRA